MPAIDDKDPRPGLPPAAEPGSVPGGHRDDPGYRQSIDPDFVPRTW